MSLRINYNPTATGTQRVLGANSDMLSKSIERLSTGYKINRAADGPAQLAISESLRAQLSGLEQATSNTQDAVNMVKTSEGALSEVHTILRSMRTLAVQSLNSGFVDNVQLNANQSQIASAIDALNRIAANTAFGGKKLLDGSAGVQAAVTSGSGIKFINGSSKTVSGTYSISVNQLATKASYVGAGTTTAATVTGTGSLAAGAAAVLTGTGNISGTAAVVTGTGDISDNIQAGEVGNLVFEDASGTILGTVAITSGMTQAQAVTAVNTITQAFADTGDRITASASGNFLRLTQDNSSGGAIIRISNQSTAATLTALGLSSETTTAGTGGLNGVSGNLVFENGDGTALITVAVTGKEGQTQLVTKINAAVTAAGLSGTDAMTASASGNFLRMTNNSLAGGVVRLSNATAAGLLSQLGMASETSTYGTGGLAGNAGNLVFEDLEGTAIASVVLNGGETQAQVVSKINAQLSALGAPSGITASASGNAIKLDNNSQGAQGIIRLSSASTAATLTKLGLASETTYQGTGGFVAQATSGTLSINNVNIDVKAYDTANALVTRINAVSHLHKVIASETNGVISLTSTVYGSAGELTVAASGGYTVANIFGTVTQSAGRDVNLTVSRTGGNSVTTDGVGQIWTGSAGADNEGLQFRVTDATAKTMEVVSGALSFQVGSEVGQTASIAVNGVAAFRLGLTAEGLEGTAENLEDISVLTEADARDTLRMIDASINEVSSMRAALGAAQKNVFESGINSLKIAYENIAASESGIRDTDIAKEMSEFSKFQIMQQTSVAMLQQANTAQQALLRLVQG